jgi:hypothetical protein
MASDLPSAAEYEELFQQLRPRLTDKQISMLSFHLAKDRPVTATELADHVGYADWQGANVQYGRIGSLLRELDNRLRQLEGQESYAFARFDRIPRRDGSYAEWVWILHEPVEEALRSISWVNQGD